MFESLFPLCPTFFVQFTSFLLPFRVLVKKRYICSRIDDRDAVMLESQMARRHVSSVKKSENGRTAAHKECSEGAGCRTRAEKHLRRGHCLTLHLLSLADLGRETGLDSRDTAAGTAVVAGNEVQTVLTLVELGVGRLARLAGDVLDWIRALV
jgi:hypothetical protein